MYTKRSRRETPSSTLRDIRRMETPSEPVRDIGWELLQVHEGRRGTPSGTPRQDGNSFRYTKRHRMETPSGT